VSTLKEKRNEGKDTLPLRNPLERKIDEN